VVHQPVSRGFAVFADAWLSGWLAEISADLRENGIRAGAPRLCAIQIHVYFTLLYYYQSINQKTRVTKVTNVTARPPYHHYYLAYSTSGVARNLIWGVYVSTRHWNFKTCANVPHVNKTVTDFGGYIPPVATPLYGTLVWQSTKFAVSVSDFLSHISATVAPYVSRICLLPF